MKVPRVTLAAQEYLVLQEMKGSLVYQAFQGLQGFQAWREMEWALGGLQVFQE